MNSRLLKQAAKWRAQYNPLRSLTFQRAVSLLEEGERGAFAELQWTYRFVEKRDATLRALKRLRLAALSKLDWDIKVRDSEVATDQKLAEDQEKVLRAAYDRIDNLRQAVAFLALAEFRGFAHLEKVYQGDNPTAPIVRLEPVPQWHWCRDTMYGPWLYNADAGSGRVTGQAIEPRHFIIREVEDPINEIGFLAYLRKNLSQKDWDGFVETYGIPPLFAEMPANTPPAKEEEYQAMAEAVVSDMRGTLPAGAKVQTVDAGARGVNPFRDHLTYQDEQVVLAGTSGKLTMLNGPTGLGSGQSEVHQDTFDELAQAEAAEISEILQKQLDRLILDAAGFAGRPALAYFELAAEDKADIGQILDHANKAKTAGLVVDAAEMSEKTGYKLAPEPNLTAAQSGVPILAQRTVTPTGVPPATLNRASPVTPPNEALATAARKRVATALADKLKPVREALQAALDSGDDAAFETALAEAKQQIVAHAKQLGLGPEDPLVRAIEESMAAAVVDGAATARQTRNRDGLAGWLRTLFRR